jgi:hypothetical protein
MNILKDQRVDCFSVMETIIVKDYLNMISEAYENKGNIPGQREPLKTKSAITIRNRMKSDVVRGTILPPIVIGIVVSSNSFEEIERMVKIEDFYGIKEIINSADYGSLSIIDGMQRTTSLLEAVNEDPKVSDRELRIEFWITKTVQSLLYRMLILNTGQVPWNLKRQIEVVYNPLIKEFKDKAEGLELFDVDNPAYRTQAGEYQAEKIIELFLIFGIRDAKVDTKGALADEFTKLDFIELTSENQLNDIFIQFLNIMISFDKIVFSLIVPEELVEGEKFKSGKDLFGSQTLKAGFMAAIAQHIFGIPGEEYTLSEQIQSANSLIRVFDSYFENLKQKNNDELLEYLDLVTLNELIGKVNKGIGDYERSFFTKAFKTLIDNNFKFQNLTPCWRAGSK